jgi:hypothetical protein
VFEFDTGVGRCEVPVGLGVAGIAIVLPGCDFLDQGLLVGNAPVEALGRQDAEFGFGEIEPTAVPGRVVPFEALDQPPGLGGWKSFVKRSLAVDIEIVLDQNDGLGAGKMRVGKVFEDVSVIDRSMAVGDLVGTAASASAVVSYFVLTRVTAVTSLLFGADLQSGQQGREPGAGSPSPRTGTTSASRACRPSAGVAVALSGVLAQGARCRSCVTRCLNGATHWFC